MADKRVTINFMRHKLFKTEQDKEFAAWRDEMVKNGAQVIYDRRNGIYCVAPTMDYEMYYNYCVYLNENYNSWVNYGYFDMGMIPYLMWPSFMDSSTVMEQMRKIVRAVGIDLIKVPSVSFLKNAYSASGVDYWIFREDLFQLCEALRQADASVYPYSFSSPDEVTLSGFLKPLAELSKIGREHAI